ncbi:MAG: MBOAT family protein [Lachnospiraceae bacterium]|nr:MBOAT family protein [Lachnospiraceae bacterium]
MLFTSITFAFFLPVIFILYWAVPRSLRWIALLVANIYFYMYGGPVYLLLLLAIAAVTWLAGRAIESARPGMGSESGSLNKPNGAKKYLIGSVVIVIGFLAFFKYANFAIGTVSGICSALSIGFAPAELKLALPLGISFYSFAAIGYVADIYKNKISAEQNFFKYLTFVSFFPSVLSGPINRAGDVIPQINEPGEFDADRASEGLRQMLWGFFKKLIIADMLARYVNPVFDFSRFYFGLTLIVATVFYTFQIYCDFSGYSDIAIGTAKLMGIKLGDNFKSPYYSRSVKEFWSRWHISLSSWFRDYVYIPLGGSRVNEARHHLNLMLTMLLSGLWHGADWSFVIWGGLHGLYQVVEDFCHKHFAKKENRGKREKDIKRSVPWNIGHGILTFGLVSFAWSFFRANNTSDAIYIATHMPRGLGHIANSYVMMLNNMGLDGKSLAWIIVLVAVLMAVDFVGLKQDIYIAFGKLPIVVRWLIYISLTVYIIVMSLNGGQHQEFIYFQF